MLLIICCFFQSLFAHPQKPHPESSTEFSDRIKPKLIRLVQTIETVYRSTEDMQGEQITPYEHALQTADLALKSQPNHPEIVVAALLHDIGRVLCPGSKDPEQVSYNLLYPIWGEDVACPVCNQIKAKRFLLAIDGAYAVHLSKASLDRLLMQGGAYSQDSPEYTAFKKEPYFEESVTLRLWEDCAKDTARATRSFQDYQQILVDVAYKHLRERFTDNQIDDAITLIRRIDQNLKGGL